MDRKLLGQYLLERRQVTEGQIQNALELQAMSLQGGNTPLIGTVLVGMGVADEQDVTAALKQQERDRQTSGDLAQTDTSELPHTDRNEDTSSSL